MARLWRQITFVSILSVVLMGLLAPPLVAKTAQPTVVTRAWYWEEAQSSEQTLPTGEKVTIDTPNPFCPGAPGGLGNPEQACAEGRLPIEIHNGDYETPNKMSAVTFDMSLVPTGSDVSKFTVTFLEAKSGCYDSADEDTDPNWCEQTEPLNVDGRVLQACKIDALYGDGDARPTPEAPRFTCAKSDPTAERKEVTKDGETSHTWTFDLTAFAKEWVKEFTTNTSIMLVGREPQEGGGGPSDSWRVVLMGPKAPEGKVGIDAEIVFDPAELEPPDSFTDPTTTTGGVTTGSSSVGSTGTISSGTSTGSTDLGGSTVGGSTTGEPTEASGDTVPPVVAAGAEQTPQGLPGYVWLAILAGLAGWSVFRSVVLENAKGIRPDGVLAQIQRLNSQNGGGAAAAVASEPSGLSTFMGKAKHSFGSLFGKLRGK